MYEHQTYDKILQRMLERVPGDLEKGRQYHLRCPGAFSVFFG
nr:hypothetical protein [Paenibacillus larvae]